MTAVWAHRGASGSAPENTLAAFRLAVAQGADGVEFDVQLTRDGEVVVIHDETVDRTTNGTGGVVDIDLAALQRLDAGEGETIPTLAQVLDLLRPTSLMINIELKNTVEPYPGLEDKVLGLVGERGLEDRVIYSSFNHYSVQALARQGLPTGLLFSEPIVEPWLYAQHVGARAIHPYWPCVEAPGWVEGCRAAGIAINCWTVNDPDAMARMIELGVDAMITNHPDAALAIRG